MAGLVDVDVLVIGGGGAGARAAIEAHEYGASVALVCKGLVGKSGATPQAWPSYEAAFGDGDPRDNPEVHFTDTQIEGRFLGDENLIWAMVSESCERVRDLERYGVKFERKNGGFLQVHHPGQTYPRCLVIKGGGYGLISGLYREIRRRAAIRVLSDVMVTRLFKAEGRVVGASAIDFTDGTFTQIKAKTTVICTGGYEQLWKTSHAAPDTTGDGIALAYRAGAELVDMEMMLFYPTVLIHPYTEVNGTLLQYEGLLNPEYVGGKLLNGLGEEFLPPGPLPVRDVFTRLIFEEVKEGRGSGRGGVFIDIAKSPKNREEIEALLNRLQSLPYKNLRELGIDIMKTPLEVSPGAHYTLGGIHIDEWGKTILPGLYAAGEVIGNIQGANRLSGNALAETQVFGARAGGTAAKEAAAIDNAPTPNHEEVSSELDHLESYVRPKANGLRPLEVKRKLKQLMDDHVGMPRDEAGLRQALERIQHLVEKEKPRMWAQGPRVFNNDWRDAIQVDLMLDTAETVIRSAALRTESRGHHQRADYPEPVDEWGDTHTAIRLEHNAPVGYKVPVIRRP